MTHDPRVLDCDTQVKELPQQKHQVVQPKLLMEIFVYLHYTEGTLYIPLEQQNQNWVADHVKYNICLECVQGYDNDYTWIEVFQNVDYVRGFEGACYIPFTQ